MKSMIAAAAVLALLLAGSLVRAQDAQETPEQMKSLAALWVKMINGGIADQAGAYMTDTYFVIDADGQHFDRKARIKQFSERKIKINDFQQSEVHVTYHGPVVIMDGIVTLEAQSADDKRAIKVRFVDVWVKKADKWKAAASTYTRVID